MSHPVVLFDLDHTLLDSDAALAAAYVDAAHVGGLDDAERWRAPFERINHDLWRAVERGEISPNDVRVRRFEALLLEVDPERSRESIGSIATDMAEAFVAGLVEHAELFPGAVGLLEHVGGRQLGLVTNGIGMVQRGRLARLGLEATFETVVISGELGVAKPDPTIFRRALSDLGEPAEDSVVMVGDNWGSDITGALNAGLDSIWLTADARHPDPPQPSVRVARSLDEVVALLD